MVASMKAAVLSHPGAIPECREAADPVAGPGQVVVEMIAASIKNLDRALAQGSHYAASKQTYPHVVGVDGVGTLPDGRLVYTGGAGGMMAERALAVPARTIPVPPRLDPAIAAALPNPALSAWFSLHGLQAGQKLLVLGATGVTGTLAVQLGKRMGAGEIVAAGRNPAGLERLRGLGADAVIPLGDDEAGLGRAIAASHAARPFDLILDYLWGRPAEIALEALAGNDLAAEAHRTRWLQIGEMAGPRISLAAGVLRSTAIEISGQGGGSISRELRARVPEILPGMFQDAAEGRLHLEVERVPLAGVAAAWQRTESGKRIVVMAR
jgi:NADPH:quinone reductase-like Zn-dependent oxidoreductase